MILEPCEVKYTPNSLGLKLGPVFDPGWLTKINCKGARYHEVQEYLKGDPVRSDILLTTMYAFLISEHNKIAGNPLNSIWDASNISVDIRNHDLEKGQVPCIPGWHIDGSSLRTGKKEYYTILSFGDVSPTVFLDDKLTYDFKDEKHVVEMLKGYPGYKRAYTSERTVYFYDSHKPHRGSAAKKDGKRTFIRLQYSENIRPVSFQKSQQYEPSYYTG